MRTQKVMLALVLLLIAPLARAQSIDLSRVQVVNGDQGILRFPATAKFTAFGLQNRKMLIQTTGTAAWPAVDIDGNGPSQAATLWVFLNINGQWMASGAERLRPGQLNIGRIEDGKPEDPRPSELVSDWLDPRWGAMHYDPQPGEAVGLMVVAGSTRMDNQTPVRERSNVIVIAWPNDSGANPVRVLWSEGETARPDPVPVPTSNPQPQSSDSGLVARIEALERAVQALEARPEPSTAQAVAIDDQRITALAGAIDQVRQKLATLSCSAAANLGVTRIPISCRVQ